MLLVDTQVILIEPLAQRRYRPVDPTVKGPRTTAAETIRWVPGRRWVSTQ